MKIPFGKHKGKELQEIIEDHTGYFIWLISIEDTLRSPLREEVIRLSKLDSVKRDIAGYNESMESYYDGIMECRESIY